MNRISQEVTVRLKLCSRCRAELLESDRFCRRCGVNQQTGDRFADDLPVRQLTGEGLAKAATAAPLSVHNPLPLTADETFAFYVTGDGLPPGAQQGVSYATTTLVKEKSYRRVSGSLVKAVAASVTENALPYFTNRFARRVIPAMILIPIWLIIILLSPLDAYATAKMLTKQVN